MVMLIAPLALIAVLAFYVFLVLRARDAADAARRPSAPTLVVRDTVKETVDAIMARSRERFGHGVYVMLAPTLADYIAKKRAAFDAKRAELAPKLAERQTLTDQIAAIRQKADGEGRQITEAEGQQILALDAQRATLDTSLTEPRNELNQMDAELQRLDAELRADEEADRLAADGTQTGVRAPSYDQVARVGREERTYSPHKSARGEASFFRDSYGAQHGNLQAQQRLQRNLAEAIAEREVSERATSTSSFGGLVVPQYLVDMAARVIRSGRPVANACTGLPLPAQGMTLDVPRGTTGAAVASQATENTALQNTDEVWADLVIPVRTIGGQQDVSRQSLERGSAGVDEIIYMDLAGAYHAELDRQVIAGSGSAGQFLGMFNTAAINAATAYGAPLTFPNFNLKVAGQIAAVAGVGSGIQPKLIFMHPRRWGWMSSLVDGQGRPLIVPQAQGVFNAGGVNLHPGAYGGDGDPISSRETTIVGSMQGLPITTDANAPVAVGTNSEDLVGVFDPNHALLWEDGDGQPRELRFEQTLGSQLTVKLVIYGYAAFTAGRYPTAFGKVGGLDTVGGNGQIAPSF